MHGDGRFLHGNLGELMASSTESGLGCCCCCVGGDGDGDGDCSTCSLSRANVPVAPLPACAVVFAAAGQTSDAEAARISAARTAAMIRRSVLRSSSHFSSAPSSFRRFSAAVSGAAAGGGGGGRLGTTGRSSVAAGEDGADSSRPMRRAMMAGGGARGLSQLERRCSGAIVGLRGASQERRRRTAVVISCCTVGFVGEAAGEAEGCWAAAFFLGDDEDGGGGGAWEARAAGAFLAVRRFRWWLRWYGEMRRRRPAMHPMPPLRLCAGEHVEGARRLAAGSGCGCIASVFPEPFVQPSGSSEARRVGACRGIIIGGARGGRNIMTASPLSLWPSPRRWQGQLRVSSRASFARGGDKSCGLVVVGWGSIRVELHTPLRALRWPLAACLPVLLLLPSG